MAENFETVKGASLWRDAWKRLLKNKLAVFGLVVLAIMVVAVIIGPTIIRWTTGLTADYIPSEGDLIKSFPPSLQHPMGTDEAGRDLLARVLQGGRISLMVGVISTFVSLIVGVSYGAIAGYFGGRIDNIMMRIVDMHLCDPVHSDRYCSAVGIRRAEHAELDNMACGTIRRRRQPGPRGRYFCCSLLSALCHG